jgi:RNA polymerase sigma-70 factor, ECF subfamily
VVNQVTSMEISPGKAQPAATKGFAAADIAAADIAADEIAPEEIESAARLPREYHARLARSAARGYSTFRDHRGNMTDLEQPGAPARPELEPALLALIDEGRRRWPAFEISDADFAAYLRERSGPNGLPPQVHAGDLLLACACARGLVAAVEAFQHLFDPTVRRVCSRRRVDPALADDARQALYERLLVSRGGQPPKIAEYRGQGRLEGWVATSASTTLLMMQRAAGRRREQPETAAGGGELAGPLDPELEFIRARYKTELEEAIAGALLELGDRERTLLRLHLGERLSIDTLGSMYGVNRATAARWLVAARQSLLERARAAMRARLGSSEEELESLGVLLQSQLHVSLARRLT